VGYAGLALLQRPILDAAHSGRLDQRHSSGAAADSGLIRRLASRQPQIRPGRTCFRVEHAAQLRREHQLLGATLRAKRRTPQGQTGLQQPGGHRADYGRHQPELLGLALDACVRVVLRASWNPVRKLGPTLELPALGDPRCCPWCGRAADDEHPLRQPARLDLQEQPGNHALLLRPTQQHRQPGPEEHHPDLPVCGHRDPYLQVRFDRSDSAIVGKPVLAHSGPVQLHP